MSKCESCMDIEFCQSHKYNRIPDNCFSYLPKPSRYDRIMQDMTIEKMAEMRVKWNDDSYHNRGGYFMCNGASGIYKTQDDAIAAEIAWLKGVE